VIHVALNPILAASQIDEQGIIEKYNECAAQTFGYSKKEAVGQNIKMLMPQDVADKHDGYLRRYVETGVKHVMGSKRGVCDLFRALRFCSCAARLKQHVIWRRRRVRALDLWV
jgi:PAS domain-containing protein